ncbi:MAG TPA: hypothetical protein VF240_20445 [Pyrinomonadaceae bacterium]
MAVEDEPHLINDSGATPGAGRRFSPEELVACEGCRRANPPTRMSCLYCGAKLPLTETSAALRRPVLRPLEEWEQGHNVVLLPGGPPASPQTIDAAAELLHFAAPRLIEAVDSREALPIARAASAEEAKLIEERLDALGFNVLVVADDELAEEAGPTRRVRKLEFTEDVLRAWTSGGEQASAPWGDVVLIAAGRIKTKRVEVEERSGRVRPGVEVVDAREIFADEAALEIHTARDAAGWRIMSGSFDYTCLGARMGVLALRNFETLIGELRARATGAAFDGGYNRLRHLLSAAWPLAEREESGGLRRERPGKFNAEAVTVVSNDAQFTRYVRLRRLLELRRRTTDVSA